MTEKINDDLFDEIIEEFLDEVYGNESKMGRKEYIQAIIEKEAWIFDSK